MSTDLERLNEALANEGVVWRVLDGDHDDYVQAHDAFAAFAEFVEEYRDLLANGQREWWCEEHDASVVAEIGGCGAEQPPDCRIVPKLLVDPTTEEER